MYKDEKIVQIVILALPNEVLEQGIVYDALRDAVSSVIEDCPNQIHIKDLMQWSEEEYNEWNDSRI